LVFVDGVITRVGAAPGGPEGRNNREIRIRSQFSAATTPGMQAKILKMTLAAPDATAVGTNKATGEALSHEDSIVNVPVLAIYAEHSRQANREYLQAHFPNLEFTEIPGTGHYLMLEKPEAFNRLLLTFLAKQK
jgi:pimeloyl-ACP methyl ester carboxylesterase